ncbi:tRNA wybutosine-synthesizing protein 2 homolog [Callorhinchus milii]|uniref:tRNA wybutosine-synthesizing protein 2 homolog n=1 Tax=Callorhinchus milii TaxID=7868 RepID=UPI001C3FA870|nr:tRNA wybutosine-synthesizing protein 2 homolog [Callorhinchus milii]XP_007889470.2 tRNA wybutosine-synthesizing protein 2 homolog [Callorhinchus milii]XP_007889477.2 tRNA wybutosine-synthesizing protein 2 homolog [Callorhinchus milii]XP_042196836.1 tRNA wybutosine-synthesizing protein 2 homolog [Callorhinchus milii]
MEAETETVAIVTQPQFAQQYRQYLEEHGALDTAYRLQKQLDGSVALPVLCDKLYKLRFLSQPDTVAQGSKCKVSGIKNPVPSKKSSVKSSHRLLQEDVQALVERSGGSWTERLRDDLPRVWKRHGDMAVLNERCFQAEIWKTMEPNVWQVVAAALGVRRVARAGRVSADDFRTPAVTLLLGDNGWVQQVDNGIRYTFDVTKCMFSSGNITEKLRISSFDCTGEVVVDLFAGLGYFTLPYLVHAGAAFVYACEWNPWAVASLRKNLELNKVAERCEIYQGDSRQLPLCSLADRVNLGLVPSSEEGWPSACRVLRGDRGGKLHIHHNVSTYPHSPAGPRSGESMQPRGKAAAWRGWAQAAAFQVRDLLREQHGRPWRTEIVHIEHVKSYAPHIDHLVLDLDCRPC